MSNNAHELSNRLLNALDNNYNVVDMHAVNEIISILEKINITKELLETTRLGKHVNELRRKTSETSLARRAKVLVKRWRDLVIPTVASPGHTGSNRSSAERSVRRHGGTPLTSPALARQVVSPAVPSPRPSSRPAWGGYESDSQDVILVDDEPAPPPPPAAHPSHPPPAPHHTSLKPLTPPVKRPPSPAPHDEKKTKRDKKPKKRRGYSRAGAGAEASPAPAEPPPPLVASPALALAPGEPAAWTARNGTSHSERRRNGYKRDTSSIDPYSALVHRMPPAGAKKVKTTKELLEEIQSRKGGKPAAASSPASSPASPASPDVMLIETETCPIKVESPLRNGSSEPRLPSRAEPEIVEDYGPLEDEREYWDCTCDEQVEDEQCPARHAQERLTVQPFHVRALHNTYLPGVNGTRAPVFPHQFAVRKPEDQDRPGLFASVVPLYKYSDYADDYCVKNMDRVPLCTHIPWTEFAPPPPDLPPPPSPPPIRPYPLDETALEIKTEPEDERPHVPDHEYSKLVEAEMVGLPALEPSERLKAPLLSAEDETQFEGREVVTEMEVEEDFASEPQEHRTVERTKEVDVASDGQALYAQWQRARDAVRYDYAQLAAAPVLPLVEPALLDAALTQAEAEADVEDGRDEFGRPRRPTHFAEWHECARLGPLVALPYVVID